jgi:cytochrome c biogenesis protein CcdA
MIHDVSILAALIAGIVSFLSPCVLPLVPPYLIYLTGATIEHVASGEQAAVSKRAVMLSALTFVLGFSTVFIALGAAAEATVAKGAGLLTVYSAGLGIPFLLAAFMIEQFSSLLARLKRHLASVERAMGVLMVLTGFAFLTGSMSSISIWLLETFPALQNFG